MGFKEDFEKVNSELGGKLSELGSLSKDKGVRDFASQVQAFDSKMVQTAAANVRELSSDDKLSLQMRESDRQRSREMRGLFLQNAFNGQRQGGEAFAYLAGMAIVMLTRQLATLDPVYRAKQFGAGQRQAALQGNERFEARQRRVDAGKSPYGLPVPKSIQMAIFEKERGLNMQRLSVQGLRSSMTPETASAYLLGAEYSAFKKAREFADNPEMLGKISVECRETQAKIKQIASRDGLSIPMLEGDMRTLAISKLCCDENGNPRVGDTSAGYMKLGDEVVGLAEFESFRRMLAGTDFAAVYSEQSRAKDAPEGEAQTADVEREMPPGTRATEYKAVSSDGQERTWKVVRSDGAVAKSFPLDEDGRPDWAAGYGKVTGLPTDWSEYTDAEGPFTELVNRSLGNKVVDFLHVYGEQDVRSQQVDVVANGIWEVMGPVFEKGVVSAEGKPLAKSADVKDMLDNFMEGVDPDCGKQLSEGNPLFPQFVALNRFRDMFESDGGAHAEREAFTKRVVSLVGSSVESLVERGVLEGEGLAEYLDRAKGLDSVPPLGEVREAVSVARVIDFGEAREGHEVRMEALSKLTMPDGEGPEDGRSLGDG